MSESNLQRFECRIRSRESPQDIEVVILEAPDKEEALGRLHRDGHLVVSIRSLSSASVKSAVQRAFSKSDRQKMKKIFGQSVSVRELIFFAVQLSTLLKAGVALVRALEILDRGTANATFSGVIRKMTKTVSEGHSLAEALRQHPKVFPWLWRTLIEVGELSGTLPQVLKEISDYQEAAERIKGKIVSALFYPAILLLIAGGAVVFLMMVIVPKFETIFASQNLTLPVPTQIVMSISYVMKNYFLIVVGVLVILFWLLRSYAKSPVGRVAMARRLLKAPIFGVMFMQISIVRFSRSLATLLNAGIPLLKALDTAAVISSNAYIEKQIQKAQEKVSQGHGLGVQLEVHKAFPPFMTQLVSVGEETGEIASFLKLLADYYEEQVDQFLSRISVLIEPIMLVIMAVMIGGIVIAIFLPIVQLSTGGM